MGSSFFLKIGRFNNFKIHFFGLFIMKYKQNLLQNLIKINQNYVVNVVNFYI